MKVSVSNLDLFRKYRDDEDMPLDILLRALRGETEPTPAMKAGTALHAILETAGDGELSSVERDGFTFRFELEDEIGLTPIRELRGSKLYLVGGESLEVRGRVDALHGRTVEDHKLTASFDPVRYADSYQWRLYLSMFGAVGFFYNVFVGSPEKKDPSVIRVREFHRLPLYWYPEIETDIHHLIGEYIEFAKAHAEVAA